ncbi:MAG: hypothetical protein CMB64_03460 [Euryarchaeota archaeon]|nr:hypothetical protein [Euryarchaeota archaeon]
MSLLNRVEKQSKADLRQMNVDNHSQERDKARIKRTNQKKENENKELYERRNIINESYVMNFSNLLDDPFSLSPIYAKNESEFENSSLRFFICFVVIMMISLNVNRNVPLFPRRVEEIWMSMLGSNFIIVCVSASLIAAYTAFKKSKYRQEINKITRLIALNTKVETEESPYRYAKQEENEEVINPYLYDMSYEDPSGRIMYKGQQRQPRYRQTMNPLTTHLGRSLYEE